MSYYNYHAKAKQLINEGHLVKTEIIERWNAISPALVLYFDNHRPMPIREYRWSEYLEFGIEKRAYLIYHKLSNIRSSREFR